MKSALFIFTFSIFVLFSCSNDSYELPSPENLIFTYKIEDTSYFDFWGGYFVDVSCNVYNGNNETLFFYTKSCYEWEKNFLVDTNFVEIQNYKCCASNSHIVKSILPKGNFEFKGKFFVKNMDPSTLTLQYYFYQVDFIYFDTSDEDLVKNLKKTVIQNSVKIK